MPRAAAPRHGGTAPPRDSHPPRLLNILRPAPRINCTAPRRSRPLTAVRVCRTTRRLGASFDEDLRPLFDPRVFAGGLAGGLAQAPLVCALEKLSWAWEAQRRR